MRSDHEITMRREPIHDAYQHLLLEGLREIGKGDIAAENEIEEHSGRFAPQVLMQEFNALSMLRLDAVEGSNAIERFLKEVRRQFSQTRWLKVSAAGTGKDRFIDIGCYDRSWSARNEVCDFAIPDDFQGVWLFA